MRNRNIIIFGSIDWKTNWQSQHRLVSSLVSNSNKVLFIENTGIRNAKLSDFSRLLDRVKFRKKSIKGFNFLKDGINILSPIIIPMPFSFFFIKLNTFLLYNKLKQFIKYSKFNNPIIITFLPTPLVLNLFKKIEPQLLIYYCANEMQGMSNKINKKLNYYENKMFEISDLVFVTSNNLKNKAEIFNNNVFLFPAGVELNKFNINNKFLIPDDLKKFTGRKIIGYIGAITQVLDIELLDYVIKKNKNYNFIFVGRVYIDISKLKRNNNCFFLGEKKHKIVPSYIFHFDVCLIPYKINEFTNSVYSCKTNEYLAIGKPVVATATKEINEINKHQENIIFQSSSYDNFNENIKKALSLNDKSLVSKRVKFAKSNSWESRFDEINNIFDKTIDKSVSKLKINKVFTFNVKKMNRKIMIYLVVFSIFIYAILYSPIYGKIIDSFQVQNNFYEKNNVIMTLGHGSLLYQNKNYQERTMELINFYNENNNINKIILTGRKQAIHESEIVNALLISKKIPPNKILLLKKLSKNTFDEIKYVNEEIKKNNIKDFVFITSYFHYYRVKLIFDKNYPEYKIFYNQDDYNYNNDTLIRKLNNYLLIFYEYLSITLNKIRNNI